MVIYENCVDLRSCDFMKTAKMSLIHLDELRWVSSREEMHENINFGQKCKMVNFMLFGPTLWINRLRPALIQWEVT